MRLTAAENERRNVTLSAVEYKRFDGFAEG